MATAEPPRVILGEIGAQELPYTIRDRLRLDSEPVTLQGFCVSGDEIATPTARLREEKSQAGAARSLVPGPPMGEAGSLRPADAFRKLPLPHDLFDGCARECHLTEECGVTARHPLKLPRLDLDPTLWHDAADAKLFAGVRHKSDVCGVGGGSGGWQKSASILQPACSIPPSA